MFSATSIPRTPATPSVTTPTLLIASSGEEPAAAPPAPHQISLVKKLVFSGLAGAVATTCIYPIDYVKTTLQDDKAVGSGRRGPIACALNILRTQGATGFYRGYAPNVILVMPEKAIKLTMNEYFRAKFSDNGTKPLSLGAEMLAGGLAGACQVTVTNPMELLKIQGATMAKKLEEGTIKKAIPYSQLIKELGATGLYTGVVATLCRDIPFSVVYFSGYSALKAHLLDTELMGLGVGAKAFLAGCGAGTFAAGMSTPLDVVKTRVHSHAISLLSSPDRPYGLRFVATEFSLVGQTFAHIIKTEGAAALWKGILPRCTIIAPLFGITMNVFELLKAKFG